MGFWKKIRSKLPFKPKQQVTVPQWTGPGFDFSNWKDLDGVGSPEHALTTNENIFSIVTRLANSVSSLPIHLFKDHDQIVNDLSDLLSLMPNQRMTGFELLSRMETDRDVYGNAFVFIERQKGQVTNLWPLPAGSVTAQINTDDHSIWYEIMTDEFRLLIPYSDMVHVKHISPVSRLNGISPIDVLNGTIEFDEASEEFSLSEMKKKDKFLVTYDRSTSEENRKLILQDIINMANSNGGAVLQEKGFEITRFDSKFQPADLASIESVSRIRIANAFNVPLSFLNDGSDKATTNVEHVMSNYVVTTLLPIIKQYEAEFNLKLLTPEQRKQKYYFKFNVNGLMRGDTAARTQFYQALIRNGIATPNDLRRLEDLPVENDPNADKLWITGDLYPMDLAVEERNSTTGKATSKQDLAAQQGNDGQKQPDKEVNEPKPNENEQTGQSNQST